MLILSFKPGHDGAICALKDSKLQFSLEAEKDSFPRYDRITPELLTLAGARLDGIPDCVAIGGWVKGWHSVERTAEAGYFGREGAAIQTRQQNFMGKPVELFSSTHERSHIMGAYGMSPYRQGQPVYCLVWEGNIGDFYEIDADVNVHHLGHVLTDPGNKYSSLFMIADPSFPLLKGHFRFEDAGKLMALAAFANSKTVSPDEAELINFVLDADGLLLKHGKESYKWSRFYDIGVQSQAFKDLAGKFSDALFQRFFDFAKVHLTKGLPLIISGGCGLNCEWNSKWAESGLFSSVFVPPCPNDSGSAIGTAVDAQFFYTGDAKISWNVYAGEEFVDDADPVLHGFRKEPLNYDRVARALADGKVLAWVQGKYEIGPRALGNRSIIAAPFSENTLQRLNSIKMREDYRPIAPVCLEEDAAQLFAQHFPSPHMLYFSKVQTRQLSAVTHVDGSARVQTVSQQDNVKLYELLRAFKRTTDFGVLCNTSLNFNGRGFINRTSDLIEYCTARELDGFVVNDCYYSRAGQP